MITQWQKHIMLGLISWTPYILLNGSRSISYSDMLPWYIIISKVSMYLAQKGKPVVIFTVMQCSNSYFMTKIKRHQTSPAKSLQVQSLIWRVSRWKKHQLTRQIDFVIAFSSESIIRTIPCFQVWEDSTALRLIQTAQSAD